MFYNEVDLLHLRLEELYPVVDKFVLVQGWNTFRGEPRTPVFHPSDPQWAPYVDKIEHGTFGLSGGSGPWERETYLRDTIGQVASCISQDDNDIVLISDADEIARRESVETIGRLGLSDISLTGKTYYYGLNVQTTEAWAAIKAVTVGRLREQTAEQCRRSFVSDTIIDAGWHFSYLGDAEFIRNKIRSFSHAELDTPRIHAGIEDAIANLRDPFGRKIDYKVVPVDDSWPHAVKNNPEFWRKHIW